MTELHRIAWRSMLIGGILSALLGLILLIWPGRTVTVLTVILGIQLIVWGTMFVIGSLVVSEGLGGAILGTIGGVLTILAGIATLRAPGLTLVVLALFLGASWVVGGILETVEGIMEKGIEGRGWLIAGGILSILAGIAVMSVPLGSVGVLAIWAGILMIMLGLMRIFIALDMRKADQALSVGTTAATA